MSEPERSGDRSKDERSCQNAYRGALDAEQSGLLREARASWATCARASCGDFLRQECTSRYTQLGSDIPSVVAVVTDAAGEPRADVQLRVDGELFAAQLDGRALPINPGLHEFSFITQGGIFSTQKLMILQGQRNRLVSASLPSPRKHALKRPAMAAAPAAAPAPTPTPGRASREAPDLAAPERPAPARPAIDEPEPEVVKPLRAARDGEGGGEGGGGSVVLPVVLAATGLAAAGAGGLLIYWGRADNRMLDQCAPSCPQSSVDHIRRMYLAGDVALGVGAAALIAAYWTYALTRSEPESRPRRHAYLFDVQPARAGAVATLSGAF